MYKLSNSKKYPETSFFFPPLSIWQLLATWVVDREQLNIEPAAAAAADAVIADGAAAAAVIVARAAAAAAAAVGHARMHGKLARPVKLLFLSLSLSLPDSQINGDYQPTEKQLEAASS